MVKAIVIGIVIVLAVVAVLAIARYFEKGRNIYDFGIFLVCMVILAVVMIFGGVRCF